MTTPADSGSGFGPHADGSISAVGPHRWEALLPVSTVQCHAANLMMLPDGSLACVWFGGTQEGTHDTSVYLSRCEPGRQQFSPSERLSADPERSEQNPLLFVAPDDHVWLFYTAQRAGNQDTAEVRARISDDSGRTWTPPRTVIPADERGGVFVRQPPVVLDDGRWVLPVFRCVRVDGQRWAGDRDLSSIWISGDAGETWTEQDVPDSLGAVHMNIVRVPDGSYRALYRSRWADWIHSSASADGVRWTSPVPTSLPNNNSSIQAVAADDGSLLLVYNHSSAANAEARRESLYDEIGDDGVVLDKRDAPQDASTDSGEAGPTGGIDGSGAVRDTGRPDAAGGGERRAFWGAPRAPLALAVSTDGGRTWPRRWDIEDGDGYCLTNDSRNGRNRELSYPSIRVEHGGTVHIAYTRHRSAIKYVRLSPEWLRERQ